MQAEFYRGRFLSWTRPTGSTVDLVPELPEMQALAERLDGRGRGAARSRRPAVLGAQDVGRPRLPRGPQGRGHRPAGQVRVVDWRGAPDADPPLPGRAGRRGGAAQDDPAEGRRGAARVRRRRRCWSRSSAPSARPAGGCWPPGDEGPLAGLGPERCTDEFRELLRTGTDGRRIHTLLRDQRTVSGIGRGYTDDTLHRARVSPYRQPAALGPEDRERLLESIDAVLAEGLEVERGRTGGLPTKVGDHWVVHSGPAHRARCAATTCGGCRTRATR